MNDEFERSQKEAVVVLSRYFVKCLEVLTRLTKEINQDIRWRIPSSGMWRRVALVGTDVSAERISTIFRAERISELGTLAATMNWSTLTRYCSVLNIFCSTQQCLFLTFYHLPLAFANGRAVISKAETISLQPCSSSLSCNFALLSFTLQIIALL
jgi:hypothetical protein